VSGPARAATVLVLRPGGCDVEVLLVRRGSRASFMANAYVFPGGRVDAADGEGEGGAALATRRCAARELGEEAGLCVPDLGELVYFARWVTPAGEPRRFDADFFLWALPEGQSPVVDETEVFDLRWYTPAAALAEYEAGKLNLPPPTACTLEDLQAEVKRLVGAGADEGPLVPRLLKTCASRRPRLLLPRIQANDTGGLEFILPWDPEYTRIAGDGEPATDLAEGAAPLGARIRRCVLMPPGVWHITR